MICVHARQSELEKMGAPALSKLVITQMDRIEHLELQVARLRRSQFGPKSEKLPVNADQLMLGLNASVIEVVPPALAEHSGEHKSRPPRRRKSRALPAHLRREVRTHLPEHSKCPCCKGDLRKLGEDASEMLEYMPGSFFVIRHVRPKMSCRKCSCVVQAAVRLKRGSLHFRARSRTHPPCMPWIGDAASSRSNSRPPSLHPYRSERARKLSGTTRGLLRRATRADAPSRACYEVCTKIGAYAGS